MYLELNGNTTTEQQEVKVQTHRFAEEVVRPASLVLDKLSPEEVIAPGSRLWEVFRAWYRLGNHATRIPEQVGGADADPLSSHIVYEELGWGASDLAISLGVASMPFDLAAVMAQLTGNREVIDEVVMPFCADTEASFIGCWAITEPAHGSDSLAVGTESFSLPETAGGCRARQSGSDWVISGQKSAWVSNGTIASHALLFCTVEPSRGMAGGGVALVPLASEGVKRGAPLDKLGQRSLNQGEIFFDEVRIPGGYMLVGPDLYPEVLSATLAMANAGMGAIFTGLARSAFEEALTYAKSRRQGGRPIADHQLVQGKLFAMFNAVEQARALSRAALVYNSNAFPPALAYSIASKVTATQAAFFTSSELIEVMGGMGLSREMIAEKLFRDARASLIEDGVNEFLSLVGARYLLDRYSVDGK